MWVDFCSERKPCNKLGVVLANGLFNFGHDGYEVAHIFIEKLHVKAAYFHRLNITKTKEQ